MKNLQVLFWTIVCALFVGVACSDEDPIPPQVTVTELTEAFSYEAGTGEIHYAIEFPVTGASIILGEPSESWLHDLAVVELENKITFAYDENTSTPDSEPRVATFTITYEQLEPIVVTISQGVQPFPFTVDVANATPMGCSATITPLDMELPYYFMATTDAAIAKAAEKVGTAGFEHLTTGAEVVMYETVSEWMSYLWNSRPKTGVFEASEEDYQNPLIWNSLEEGAKPRIIVCGIAQDESGNAILTTFAQTIEVELLAYPTLTIPEAQLKQSVGVAAGEFLLDLTIANPIEGQSVNASTKASWLKPEVDENGNAVIKDGKFKVAFEANPYGSARTATLTLKYNYASSIDIAVTQEANKDAAPITFTITIKERHWDHILVDITPSDEQATCCVGALSKAYYEGGNYQYDGTDAAIVNATINAYGTQRFVGKQTDLKITKFSPSLSESSNGEEYYVWVYAADGGYGAATGAISEVTKELTTIVYDKPALNIVSVAQTVDGTTTNLDLSGSGYSATYYISPKPATIVVTYEVLNPSKNGEVRINGSPSNYYNVIADKSWTLDTEKKQLTFTTNAYNAEQYSHNATIYLAYYGDGPSDTSSDATVNIKVTQNAE